MAIKKENKFDKAVAQLNEQETAEREKSDKVLKTLSSGHKTKTVVDKNGRVRTIKITEKRKTLPVYIPETLYEQFDAITTADGKSNNSAIVELIRNYVIEKKSLLKDS